GVELHRKLLARRDELVEQRKAPAGRQVSQKRSPVEGRQVGQRAARERTAPLHPRLRYGTVRKLPGFAHAIVARGSLAKDPMQRVAAPRLGQKDGRELEEGKHGGKMRNAK